jgi:hypothetical protein
MLSPTFLVRNLGRLETTTYGVIFEAATMDGMGLVSVLAFRIRFC